MTSAEMKRRLKKQGCRFIEGTRHTVVVLGTRRTYMPRHPSKELKSGTVEAILKDLGLKDRKEK